MSAVVARSVRAAVPRWLSRYAASPAVRVVVPLWLGARGLCYLVAAIAGQTGEQVGRPPAGVPWLFGVFARYDAQHFERIAQFGMLSRGPDDVNVAFFPAYPLAARGLAWLFGLGHPTTSDYYAALATMSAVGALVGGLLLWHWVAASAGARAATVASALLLAGPFAFPLVASYSEGVFLALALGSWLGAERGRWRAAGWLAAAAALTRVSGAFLAAGLAVRWWRQPAARRAHPFALAPPALAIVGWMCWLRAATGHWDAWLRAQRVGWGRRTVWPWQSLITSIGRVVGGRSWAHHVQNVVEIVVAVLLVLGLRALARERRWPEACYVGLATAALLTSTYYVSVARSTVVAFPLYLLAARRVVRARRRVRLLLAAVSVTWLCLGAFFHVHAHQLG